MYILSSEREKYLKEEHSLPHYLAKTQTLGYVIWTPSSLLGTLED